MNDIPSAYFSSEIVGRVGALEGRLGALESRMDRNETTMAGALDRVARSVEALGAEHRLSHSAIKTQIDKIESKLDHEEGARAQAAHDRVVQDKSTADQQEAFFSAENLRLMRWTLVVTGLGVLVGLIGQEHFHILALTHD